MFQLADLARSATSPAPKIAEPALPCPLSFVPCPSSRVLDTHAPSPYTQSHHVHVGLPYVRQRTCASAPGFGVAGESCDMALEQGRPIWVDKPALGAYHQFSLSAFVPKLARFWGPKLDPRKALPISVRRSRREICDAGRKSR